MTTDEDLADSFVKEHPWFASTINRPAMLELMALARQDEARRIFAELDNCLVPEFYINEKGKESEEWYVDMSKEKLSELKKKFGVSSSSDDKPHASRKVE